MIYEDLKNEKQISFYLYKIKKLGNLNKIEYIIQANISYDIAELNEIKDWSYHKVIQETNNSFLLEGLNIKGNKRWISKELLKLKTKLTREKRYSLAHLGFIRLIENDEDLNFL